MLIICKENKKVPKVYLKSFDLISNEEKKTLLSMRLGKHSALFNSGGTIPFIDLNNTDSFINSMKDSDAYAIYTDDGVIGYFYFYSVMDGNVLSVFYMLNSYESGKGYGKEMIKIIFAEALKKMDDGEFKSFELLIDEDNVPSIKLIEQYFSDITYKGYCRGLNGVNFVMDIHKMRDVVNSIDYEYIQKSSDIIKKDEPVLSIDKIANTVSNYFGDKTVKDNGDSNEEN